MRNVDRRITLRRRAILQGAASVPVAAAGMGLSPQSAWAQAAKNLRPATLVTLARAARDIFPHDGFPDAVYITAVSGYDALAAEAALRELIEGGVDQLDAESRRRHGAAYAELAQERDRVALLRAIAPTPFFQRLRGDLVVTLYNQRSVWTRLGYEGPSYELGGYIHRGFDDIDWLPAS
ncbi:Gluconate 2-dehydrogenase subunit 3 family protein [Rhodovastum atsumiense]|uniref:Gluconate 2-dehydrogenase subunit 3 family protein n=1 Tax=Rhodovastum atsumiense TaxID=504468 RepID=A0A5M6IQQ6_9PROT|nr:gluconate 2-dehydrogenase subunit 3 family protein [Rhodovastum atsumiense]KAA5610219.1 gluconate 2-dehydrogenase subunit 3 family protein [Rhodovastum atsumiense]CAH2604165.1 Gluconate 2-dehydrogenase subunit 3 family protein [Rhodovastum atsumiense]